MRHALITLLLCVTGTMFAQDIPKIDVFGGYSYANARNVTLANRINLNGWSSSVAYNFNRWLGFVAEGSGHYGSQAITLPITCPLILPNCNSRNVSQHIHTLTLGPRFSYRTNSRFTPFGHVLMGEGYDSETDNTPLGAAPFHHAKSSFVWKTGVGVDYALNPRLALRTQTDFVHTHFFGSTQHDFQLSTGVVVHFGTK
jgi:opacity protein-like surface antigen